MKLMHKQSQSGFTLVELLVVIFIIGTLAGLLLTNFVGVRGRATDTKKKNDLRQLKSALRLYYNDYNVYPEGNNGTLLGCGANTPPNGTCTEGDDFSGGSNDTMYMKELPTDFQYFSDGDEEFLLITILENASDEDIEQSHTRCDPDTKTFYMDSAGPIADNEYVVCED
jgi:general secretion pathway protein G